MFISSCQLDKKLARKLSVLTDDEFIMDMDENNDDIKEEGEPQMTNTYII